MKILWIVNMLLPDAADFLGVQTGSSGTWLIDISRKLSGEEDIQLAVACVYGKEFKRFKHNNITYYLLPGTGKNMLFYTKKYESLWKEINEEFKPDLVHIHGTEYSHGLSFLKVCPEVKSVISVQGVLNRIKDVDFGSIPLRHFIFGRTLRQNIRLNGEIEMHLIHKLNAKHEKEMLSKVRFANCVNTWDSSVAKSINPNLEIFKLEYNLREEMYSSRKWSTEKIQRHTIFTNPGGIPLKGIHKLIEAVNLLKDKYPDILLKVPGMAKSGRLSLDSAYAKYINRLIKKYKLENHVEFLGRQSGEQMCENMLKANVTVVPSATESVSLILREAMFLGCPSIAAFTGGMADFISDKLDGFLYDYQEYPYLATRIDELFSNDSLCNDFSKNAIKKAEKAHDRQKNVKACLDMYKKICEQ